MPRSRPIEKRVGERLRALREGADLSQAELAQFLGISRQVVNGYLRAWEREGHVELGRGSIRIRDFAALS